MKDRSNDPSTMTKCSTSELRPTPPDDSTTHLLEAGSDLECDVDEDRADVALVDLGQDARQAAHRLDGDVVVRVLLVVHSGHHGRQDGRRVPLDLQQ